MKFNKKIINFCNAQLVLFLLFLLVVAFHLDNLIHYDTTVALLVRIILVTIALLGCALTLALKDYVQNMVQSEATDAVGIHNKKALEKKLNQIQELDDTLDVGIMMFDMNGILPPNRWGKDIFGINIYDGGKIEPFGFDKDMIELKKDCSDNGTGIDCSYYYKIGGGFDD